MGQSKSVLPRALGHFALWEGPTGVIMSLLAFSIDFMLYFFWDSEEYMDRTSSPWY